jgi:hypothetical protein
MNFVLARSLMAAYNELELEKATTSSDHHD